MILLYGIPTSLRDAEDNVYRHTGRRVRLERVPVGSVFYVFREIGHADNDVKRAYISRRDARRLLRLYYNTENVKVWRQMAAREEEMGMTFLEFESNKH